MQICKKYKVFCYTWQKKHAEQEKYAVKNGANIPERDSRAGMFASIVISSVSEPQDNRSAQS